MQREGIRYTLQRPMIPREVVVVALEIRNSYAAFLRNNRGYDQNHINLTSHPDQPLMEDITGLKCLMPANLHQSRISAGKQILIIGEAAHDDFSPRLFRQVIENLSSRLPFNEY